MLLIGGRVASHRPWTLEVIEAELESMGLNFEVVSVEGAASWLASEVNRNLPSDTFWLLSSVLNSPKENAVIVPGMTDKAWETRFEAISRLKSKVYTASEEELTRMGLLR